MGDSGEDLPTGLEPTEKTGAFASDGADRQFVALGPTTIRVDELVLASRTFLWEPSF